MLECPACATELRLTEELPPALRGTHVVVACANAACARDLVLAVPEEKRKGASLLLPAAAHAEEQARAKKRARLEVRRFAFPLAVVIGGGACGGGCTACAEGPGPFVYALALFMLAYLFFVGIARLGLRLDAKLAAKRWLSSLPRAHLGLAAPPKSYRG